MRMYVVPVADGLSTITAICVRFDRTECVLCKSLEVRVGKQHERERVPREEGKMKATGQNGENGLRWLESQTSHTACGPLNVLKTVCWLRERAREGLSVRGTSGLSRSRQREQLLRFIFISVPLTSVSAGNMNTLT